MTSKIYQLDKVKQLIDLNGDTTNFQVEFRIISKDKVPFYYLVVNQDMLDDGVELKYKNSQDGVVYSSFTYNKNKYQTYFLVLKSLDKCECEVSINKIEIKGEEIKEDLTVKEKGKCEDKENNLKKIFFIFGVGIIVLFFLYYFFYKKSPKKDVTFKVENFSETPQLHQSSLRRKVMSPSFKSENFSSPSAFNFTKPSMTERINSIPNNSEKTLLQRLKNLQVK